MRGLSLGTGFDRNQQEQGPIWTPADLGENLVLWIDADQETGYSEDEQIDANIMDHSGNASTPFTPSIVGTPTYSTNEVNGKAAYILNALTPDRISLAKSGPDRSQPNTIVLIAEIRNTTSGNPTQAQLFDGQIAGKRHFLRLDDTTAGTNEMRAGGTVELDDTLLEFDVPKIYVSVFNTTASYLRLNAVQHPASAGNVGTHVLADMHISGGYTNAAHWGGALCEFLVYADLMSAEDIASLETYAANKWGLTLS